MEEPLKDVIEEAQAMEEELVHVNAVADTETVTLIRRNKETLSCIANCLAI
jgi:hypothetical protein